jgi:1,4-dihydroxy-2-naphthoate polyprenyltransferase
MEVCTVLVNEYFDFRTDKLNQNWSAYTGGSRVLVDGLLSFRQIRTAIFITLCLLILSTVLLFFQNSGNEPAWSVVGILLLGLFLGVGYTAPPMKFCYRGLGELVVAATNGPYVLLAGFFFQTRSFNSPLPWLLCMPLFLAVFAAITISALPDYSADKAVSKRTLAVLFGPRNASALAVVSTIFAASSNGLLLTNGYLRSAGTVLLAITVPHAAVLGVSLLTVIRRPLFDRRIDGIMRLALLFILWFGLIPLFGILWIVLHRTT